MTGLKTETLWRAYNRNIRRKDEYWALFLSSSDVIYAKKSAKCIAFHNKLCDAIEKRIRELEQKAERLALLEKSGERK